MSAPALRPVYAVAARAIACDRPIPALVPLQTQRSDRRPDLRVRWRPVALPSAAPAVFDGNARVGTRCCRVRSLATRDCDFLQISGAGAFAISREQGCIDVDPEPDADGAAIEEALLGPALVLALARRGVFVLHASAVILRDHGVAGFLGESGAGKSTLARLLVETGEGVALAADDLLAVTDPVRTAAALPHFPQLKLDQAAMEAIAGLAPSYPLLRLFVLEPAPSAATVGSEALSAVSAAAVLLRHTLAGRLFPDDLLAAHLGFAAGMAGRVPVRRLTVPRRLDVGSEILQCANVHNCRDAPVRYHSLT